MRELNCFCGILALVLLGAGCAGGISLSHPVSYDGHGASIRGSSTEPPSSTILAAGSVRATTVVAEAEAGRITARAGISRAHALLIEALTPELAACMHGADDGRERDLSTCIGRYPWLLQTLLSEDPSFGSYFGGGGVGGPGYYFPMFDTGPTSAYADTVGGYGAVGSADLSRRVERLERATGEAVDMFHGYTVEGTTDGGAR
ncbi:hypothetical protein EPO33_04090 [Patescibacteria group bacterium]|nr:MAG: hypothetical protein EPO33_04090 [Patescibacteria group bacterium]